ncbi:hypothetical protein M426DRAFT_244196 [Hypoxylon sp. CI-4A]|nr:hypothetical protein M426DRAFT_244196 [Hypoxylon sp. CI-4A]
MSGITKSDQGPEATLQLERIVQWRSNISQANETEDTRGVLCQMCDAGRTLYQECVQKVNRKIMPSSLYRRLKNGYTHYLIWANDFGVLEGELDILLEQSRQLRRQVVRLLGNINTILWKGLDSFLCATLPTKSLPIELKHTPARFDVKLQALYQTMITAKDSLLELSDTPDDLDSESESSEEEVEASAEEEPDAKRFFRKSRIKALLDEIELLVDLGPRLEEPVRDFDINQQPAPPEPWSAAHYFTDRVFTKFPKCDIKLATVLGKLNWDTMKRLHTTRESVANEPASSSKAPLNRDSGYGTSVPTASSYAMTILSYSQDGVTRTKIPPLPKDIDKGQLFGCIACGRHVEKQNMRSWKRHLLADLRPWICCQMACPCDHKPFATREEWVEHLRIEHARHPDWDDKTCPICSEVVADGGHSIITHLAHHLEEISLAILPCDPIEEDDGGNSATSLNEEPIASPGKRKSGTLGTWSEVVEDWYCCKCGEGPMISATTIACVYCYHHIRCAACKTENPHYRGQDR